jgi:hypothetical protein
MPRKMDPELREQMKETAREVCREMIEALQSQAAAIGEFPPEPDTVRGGAPGRRGNRRYRKASFTIDDELWKLFEAERDKLKLSNSRMMDTILWRYFGKPRLSYESESDDKPRTTIELPEIDRA